MPLDEDGWDEATPVRSDTEVVRDFLRDNEPRAYSAVEVVDHLADDEFDDDALADVLNKSILVRYYLGILDRLVEAGNVDERTVDEASDDGSEITVSYFRFEG